MPDDLDPVARYGNALGFNVRRRTMLVEGNTDSDLFALAASLEEKETGTKLLGQELAIIAAGDGDEGGTNGIIRELLTLRNLARTYLNEAGTPKYRFVGLFDNDTAGRLAIRAIRDLDKSVLEFKDVFRLFPLVPMPTNLDPAGVQKACENANLPYKGLDWELEDMLGDGFINDFMCENPTSVRKATSKGDKIHRDFTRDGKARLHYFVRKYAIRKDVVEIIELLKVMRKYLGLK